MIPDINKPFEDDLLHKIHKNFGDETPTQVFKKDKTIIKTEIRKTLTLLYKVKTLNNKLRILLKSKTVDTKTVNQLDTIELKGCKLLSNGILNYKFKKRKSLKNTI